MTDKRTLLPPTAGIQKRPGMKYVADLGKGPPLKLEMKGDQVRVLRNGRVVAGITKNGALIRIVDGQGTPTTNENGPG